MKKTEYNIRKIRIKITLTVLLSLCGTCLYSQSPEINIMPSVIPPSPQSLVFERYLNHKVTEYNGLPEINIPLYEIKIKGLNIPITLSYHAGGVRFGQYDGEIGAGWSIGACGYRISRSLNNKPDEATDFYNPAEIETMENNGNSKQLDILLSGICDLGTTDQVNHHPYGPYPGPGWDQDGEYDLFTYLSPTTSSKFIISDRSNKSDLQVKILDTNLDKVKITNTNSSWKNTNIITGITLTDGQGVVYNYGGYDGQNEPLREKTVQNDTRYGNFNTAWPLRLIQTPFNGEVKFIYETFWPVTDPNMSYQLNIQDAFVELDHDPWVNYSTYSSSGVFISKKIKDQSMLFTTSIETDNETVRFVRLGNDNPQYKYLLKEITVTSKSGNHQVKKIIFNHEYYCYHWLLTSIDVCYPDTETPVQRYLFNYNRLAQGRDLKYVLPDLWGYHKYIYGADRTDILPEEFGNDNYVDANQSGQLVARKLSQGFTGYFSNRSGNDTYTGMYDFLSLKQIIFPTGGTTQYEYEPNKYYDHIKSSIIQGGGQRIKKITSSPALSSAPVVTEFKYGLNEDGLGIPNFPLNYKSFSDELYFCEKYISRYIAANFDLSIALMENGIFTHRIYSENPVGDAGQQIFSITYPQVTTCQYNADQQSYNGKTVSYYSNNDVYIVDLDLFYPAIIFDNLYSNNRGPLNVVSYNFSREPKLQEKIIYNSVGTKQKKESYQYQALNSESFEGIKARQKIFFTGYSDPDNTYHLNENTQLTDLLGELYQYHHYAYVNQAILLTEKTTVEYPDNTMDSVKIVEQYRYDPRNRLEKTIVANSDGVNTTHQNIYPFSTDMLAEKNMVADPVSRFTLRGSKEISRIQKNYPNGSIYPSSVYTRTNGDNSTTVLEITYDLYDSKGNIRQFTPKDGVSTVYLWGYNYQYPIAEIKNATYSDVTQYVNEINLNSIAGRDELTSADSTTINNLRNQLPNAHITTYTYNPLIGIRTVIDFRNVKTKYFYDNFGRLSAIKDDNDKIIESYEYHYKNP
jgi:hypothetical protein